MNKALCSTICSNVCRKSIRKHLDDISLLLPYGKTFSSLLKMESDKEILQSEISYGRTINSKVAFSTPEAWFAHVIHLTILLYLPEPHSCISLAVH